MDNYVAIGGELAVNSSTAYTQYEARSAALSSGGFVVVWTTSDPNQDGSGNAVKAQIYDADGNKLGGEFLVDGSVAGSQFSPTVTGLADGGFMVAWVSDDTAQDGSGHAIKARAFDANGAAGGEFLVNSSAAGNQLNPQIATLADGNVVISWDDGGSLDLNARIFGSIGTPIGSEFKVNSALTGTQDFNQIVALAEGGFVAVWRTTDTTQDGSNNSVKAQLFDSSGSKVGAEFLVNSNTLGAQADPSIAALPDGDFVVTWTTSWNTDDGSLGAVKAQIFGSDGAKIGGELLVNTAALNHQIDPVVTALPDNGFIIAWTTMDTAQDGSGFAIKAQLFDASGTKQGSEFLVNTSSASDQFNADVITLDDGRVMISWTDKYGDGAANWAVRGQIFGPEGGSGGANVAPVITSNGGDDAATPVISENSSIAAVVTASDANGDEIIFSITGGADAARFAINAQTGVLSFVNAPNYEAPTDTDSDNIYEVVVSASDGTLSDSQALSVTIADVNEPLAFTSSNNIGLPEIYGGPFTARAIDPETPANAITYSISGGADAALFTIDPVTGELAFIAPPDFEAPADAGSNNQYDVTLSADDGVSTATQAIVLTVYNVNEAPVIYSNGGGASATIAVDENGTAVTTVQAGDAEGSTVTYAIAGGADAARFTIDPETGLLSFIETPDFEASGDSDGDNQYQVSVTASDGTLSDTQSISVTVGDVTEASVIVGTAGNDTLDGTAGADTIDGLAGDDHIYAGSGSDTVSAGEGSDEIGASADGTDDLYDGGTGLAGEIDVVSYYEALAGIVVDLWLDPSDLSVHVYSLGGGDAAGIGADRLVNIEGIIGSRFTDVMTGNDADNILDGGDGGDIFIDGAGSDIILGGEGLDQITASTGAGNDIYDGGEDILDPFNNHDLIIYGGASAGVVVDLTAGTAQSADGGDAAGIGVDQLVDIESVDGSWYDDQITGSADDNDLRGLGGNDVISGGDGYDWLSGDDGDDVIDGGAGIDRANYTSSAVGVTVSLAITGPQNTGQGTDTLTGIENLSGSLFDDRLSGNEGANSLLGFSGADYLYGNGGDDRLEGFSGDDRLFGGAGNDTLIGGTGYDRMYGGVGDDTYRVNDTDDYAYENEGEGTDQVIASIDHQLRAHVENLTLSGSALIGKGNELGNDITGNANGNRLYGYGGNDQLNGEEGDDYLFGDVGNDTLTGGAGHDRMYGGTGDDRYVVTDAADYAYENAGEGTDRVVASINHTLRANIEELELSGSAALRGWGNAGDNNILGNGGANLLYGRDGSDAIWGATGNDILYGENGDDELQGGAGQDRVYGGAGADSFIFVDSDFAGMSSGTADRIHDFSQAERDVIELTGLDANSHFSGDQGFAFIGDAGFSGAAGELRYYQASGQTYVQGDTNGDGVADFMIRLDGLHSLTSGDFVL